MVRLNPRKKVAGGYGESDSEVLLHVRRLPAIRALGVGEVGRLSDDSDRHRGEAQNVRAEVAGPAGRSDIYPWGGKGGE